MNKLVGFIFLLYSVGCAAQAMYVEHGGADSVGNQWVYEFKEQTRRSSIFSIADAPGSGISTVSIATLDRSLGSENSNEVTVVSIVVYMDISTTQCPVHQMIIFHSIYMAGQNRISDSVRSALADIDKSFSELRKELKKTTRQS